ncbi:MAG: 6,7-dimethyl-8-ribityllumazine synthase [Candidatus Levybacteria bacterium]|nr:6,7-dimethyl-8-ribityllumazine synthase [Candidatus Levybacteria bacterium]
MKKTKDIKIAIVGSNYHGGITENLEKNCLKTLLEKGLKKDQITKIRVPGALEIPLAVQKLAKKNIYDAIIVFGAIHKGKTYHFELIANECSRACMDISLKYEVPVVFEVLAAYDIKDALERATREKGNKGVEGALTALEMIKVLQKIEDEEV